MRDEMTRYVVGFLLIVGLIVLAIILIVRGLLSSPSQTGIGNVPADLTSYAGTGTVVRYSVDSPVVAPENHHTMSITVGNYQTTFTLTQGYEGQVVRTSTYPMSTSAYEIFLRSLKSYGFDQGNNNPALKDERGQCALGSRMVYEILDSTGDTLQHYWSTTCGSGTFSGNAAAVKRLFTTQVPDYSKQVAGVAL